MTVKILTVCDRRPSTTSPRNNQSRTIRPPSGHPSLRLCSRAWTRVGCGTPVRPGSQVSESRRLYWEEPGIDNCVES